MQVFNQRINQVLDTRRQQGLTRRLLPVQGGNQQFLSDGNHQSVNFSSNNYLGLAHEPEVIRAWQQGLEHYGAGSGASPLVTGYSAAHRQLENDLCHWLNFERAILFNSGFSANQALVFALLEKGDVIFQDKLNHASLMEAALLSPATLKRFAHNDVADLMKKLSMTSAPSMVVTEGVFSMDGDMAPLKEMRSQIGNKALFAVDDAHGVGVIGQDGRGSCDFAGIQPNILIVTFGKALGISGAAIMCDRTLGDYLTQTARHFVYSTAMPPAQAHALSFAIKKVKDEVWRREKLQELSEYYDRCMADFPGYCQTPTSIKPFIIGESEEALNCAEFMKSRGVWLSAIRAPTVARNSARLRVTLTTLHDKDHIDLLAENIETWLETRA